MTVQYHLNVDGAPRSVASAEDSLAVMKRLEDWTDTSELTVESVGSSWLDYADLAVKAVIAASAVAIAARLP